MSPFAFDQKAGERALDSALIELPDAHIGQDDRAAVTAAILASQQPAFDTYDAEQAELVDLAMSVTDRLLKSDR